MYEYANEYVNDMVAPHLSLTIGRLIPKDSAAAVMVSGGR